MRLSFVDRADQLDSEVRNFAERRLLFALSRFGDRVTVVRIVVKDLNGPRGGIDKSCKITVQLRNIPRVAVTSEAETLHAAIAAAADRVGHAVSRALDKQRTYKINN